MVRENFDVSISTLPSKHGTAVSLAPHDDFHILKLAGETADIYELVAHVAVPQSHMPQPIDKTGKAYEQFEASCLQFEADKMDVEDTVPDQTAPTISSS